MTNKGEVCRLYAGDLTRLSEWRRGQYNKRRNVAIDLSRPLTSDTLKKIGEAYGIGKYSSVRQLVDYRE